MENVLLSVRHLKKAFGDHAIFEDFNLDVHKGEVVVIIGPSGCGKSTLLRCLNGLEPIQGGEILLDGQDVNGGEGVKDPACLTMTTESLTREFPLYTPSLLNLVKTSETHVKGLTPED